jgi:hypothetical protein
MTTRARIGQLEHDNHDSTFRLEPLGHGSKRQEIYGQGCRPGQLVQDSWDRTDVKVQPVWDRSTWKEQLRQVDQIGHPTQDREDRTART